MIEIKHFVIGLRPSSKLFRLPSVAGLIIDEILAKRGTNVISDEYYSKIAADNGKEYYELHNRKLGNSLIFTVSDIIFKKSYYKNSSSFSHKKVISEFKELWAIIDKHLKIVDIRRIGIAVQHRFDDNDACKTLIKSFTNFEDMKHPAKFRLHFENRHSTPAGNAPDVKKDDFVNVIYDFYESGISNEHPSKKAFNANLDVQRYYSPLVKSKVTEQVDKVLTIFKKEKIEFEKLIQGRGILENE
ncbi:MAG: hypothetical protein K8R67_14680 [Desulfobacteraceae bacterium]|nr:hypothetical protein [Desulfobacteraceae bacterium]